MLERCSIAALAVVLSLSATAAAALDGYPDFRGQWARPPGGAQWDPSKPGGLRQQPPLTPEYQALFEANMKSLGNGNEVEVKLPGRFKVSPQIAGAIKAVSGVVTVEAL